jgi:outer membrane autotransporter protein
MLSYGQHHDDVRRYIAFGSYQEGPNANSGGNDFTGRGEVATRLSWRGVSFMPYAALQWTMANADSFEEGGGAATDLFGGARRENLVTSSLGVRARSIGLWPSTLVGGISMTSLSGGLAWIHQSGCLDGQVVASFLEDTAHTPFLSTAGSIGADRAEANLAVNTTWSSGWHLQLRLSGDAGHAIHSAEAFAGVGVDFY